MSGIETCLGRSAGMAKACSQFAVLHQALDDSSQLLDVAGLNSHCIDTIREEFRRASGRVMTMARPQAIASATVRPNGSGCVGSVQDHIEPAIDRHGRGTCTGKPAASAAFRRRAQFAFADCAAV